MSTVCPNCGLHFDTPRMNKRGEGAWYANGISTPRRAHKVILMLLYDHGCLSEAKAVSLDQIHAWVIDYVKRINALGGGRRLTLPKKQALSGRVSELVGMGYCVKTKVQVQVFSAQALDWHYVERPGTYLDPQSKFADLLNLSMSETPTEMA